MCLCSGGGQSKRALIVDSSERPEVYIPTDEYLDNLRNYMLAESKGALEDSIKVAKDTYH